MPPPAGKSVTLTASGQTTLALVGGIVTGTVEIGPSTDNNRGPANWFVDGVIVQTNRPGVAPVPRVQIYLDVVSVSNSQGVKYDGSFGQGQCALDIVRGGKLIAVWTGGQVGDLAAMTVTGVKW